MSNLKFCALNFIYSILFFQIKFYIFTIRTIATLTCAKLATARPKVNAMCKTVGGMSNHVMQEAQPMRTNRNVPRISANSITRKSSLVTSSRPTNSLTPAKKIEEIQLVIRPIFLKTYIYTYI